MVVSIPIKRKQFYLVSIIFWQVYTWCQILLSIINSVICTEVNVFKYCYVTLTIQFNIS